MKTRFRDYIKKLGKKMLNDTAPEGGADGDGVLTHIPGKIKVEDIDTMNIWNILWNSKYSKRQPKTKEKFRGQVEYNHVIHGIDYNKAKKEFGQQNGTFRGEFFFKIWKFEYMGYEFLLFCDGPNAGKGSSIEVIGRYDESDYLNNKKLYNATIGFEQKMYKIFK